MRVGGAFPFPQNAVPIYLGQGEQCYVPEGNFLLTLGFATELQWFDPTDLIWRSYAQPLTQSIQIESDGYNWRLCNMSGVVVGGTITNAGSGGTNGIGATQTGVSVSFGAAPANGVAAAGYAVVG